MKGSLLDIQTTLLTKLITIDGDISKQNASK
jgi:hypothetical protein